MNNPLDKLFKDKLVDHAQIPSANAWTRVEAGLSKKNKGLILFRIAASVLLVSAIAGTTTWLSYRNPSSSTILTEGTKPNSEKLQELIAPATIEKNEALPPLKEKKSQISPSKRKNLAQRVSPKKGDTQVEIPAKESASQAEVVVSPSVITPEITTVASEKRIEKPIVLEYRLETIETQTSTQETPVAEAKEKNGFRKVIDFALDAKNSNPLGDLRVAKEELFAFNFKKEKQKNAK